MRFLFDTFLVVAMVIETWVFEGFVLLSGTSEEAGAGGAGATGHTTILRIFRLMKMTRMARMVRLLRAVPEVVTLVKALTHAYTSVFFTFVLLTCTMYTFALIIRQLSDHLHLEPEFVN